MTNDQPTARVVLPPWLGLVGIGILFFAGFALTPGLLENSIVSSLAADPDVGLGLETLVAAILAFGLLFAHRSFNRVLFRPSRMLWLYSVPAAAAIVLPLHFGIQLPLWLYILWMTVSVFWQDYITFGLLQSHLGRSLPGWLTVAIVTVMFWAAHAVLLTDRFLALGPSLLIVALGLVLSSLRAWLGTLHLILAMHLTFYLVLA